MIKVVGQCPRGCGATLFLGNGGYVTCSYLHCPEPDAASKVLENTYDIQQFRNALELQVPRHAKSCPAMFEGGCSCGAEAALLAKTKVLSQ